MDFSSDEAIFSQEYFVYCKEKWRTAGGKDPLFGHVDGFQIDPKIFSKDFNWSSVSEWFGIATNLAFRDNPCGQEVRGAPSSGWGCRPRSGMYLLNVYSIFKVREVFALTNQLGTFF